MRLCPIPFILYPVVFSDFQVTTTAGENDLDQAEVNIISGALELRKKTVADVMTRIEDVFMLDYDSVLDFATVSEIMKSGESMVVVRCFRLLFIYKKLQVIPGYRFTRGADRISLRCCT